MITSLTLRNFKGHRETTVPLGRFAALVGPNGSGKTSVLEALWLQSRLVHGKRNHVLAGDWAAADFRRRGASGSTSIGSTGLMKEREWFLQLTLAGTAPAITWRWNGSPNVEEQPWSHDLPGAAGSARSAVGRATLYQLDGRRIASAAYSDEPQPEVERDGTNTAVALAAMKLGYDEAFARVEEQMRRLIPNVERVRIRQAKVQRPNPSGPHQMQNVLGNKVYIDFRGAPDVPAHAASEGTLITLALLTVLHGPNRPNVLLLDDFDRSLHPQAQMEFIRVIKQLLEAEQDIQIVATTHSPYILDEFDPSDVHVFALGDDDAVVVKRLSDHPEAGIMKGTLSAGQLWSLDPEREWVPAEKEP